MRNVRKTSVDACSIAVASVCPAATRVSARESSAVEIKSTFTVSLEDKSPNAESESPATCAPWKSRATPSTVTLT